MSTVERQRPNDTVPIGFNYIYLLEPGPPSNQWVRITAMDNKYVWYSGIYPNNGTTKIRKQQFDDAIWGWQTTLFALATEDGLFVLATESGAILDWRV